MANLDLRTGGTLALAQVDQTPEYLMVYKLDTSAVSITATDMVVQMFNIPANTRVIEVITEVITAEGGTCTFDLGDAADTGRYLDGASANSAAGTILYGNGSTGGTDVPIGRFYEAAGVISAIFDHLPDTAVLEFKVRCFDFSKTLVSE